MTRLGRDKKIIKLDNVQKVRRIEKKKKKALSEERAFLNAF
jgi:hypothetical protein